MTSIPKLILVGINTTSTTILLLSNDIGKRADRINVMADKIGVMADRIVLTETMLAQFAHKLVDTGHELATARHVEARGVPAAPYAAPQAQPVGWPVAANPAPGNDRHHARQCNAYPAHLC